MHCERRAASRAAWTAGNSSAMSTAMIAMTTSSSMSVKPGRFDRDGDMKVDSFLRRLTTLATFDGKIGMNERRTTDGPRRPKRPLPASLPGTRLPGRLGGLVIRLGQVGQLLLLARLRILRLDDIRGVGRATARDEQRAQAKPGQ